MMNWIEWTRNRLRGRPDSEHEQALIRVVIMSLIFLYFSTTELDSVTLLAGNYLAVSIVIFTWILISPAKNLPRRVLGMIGDMAGASFGLALAGEARYPAGRPLSLGHCWKRVSLWRELSCVIHAICRSWFNCSHGVGSILVRARSGLDPVC